MTLLTIFSAPKPFTDPHINIIQRNALQSWINMGDHVEVLLIGDEQGLKDVAEEYAVRHIPDVARNEFGTPLVNDIFAKARQATSSPYLMYVNGDILLLPDTLAITQNVAQLATKFLIIGRRWDLDVTEPLTFDWDWVTRLKQQVKERGVLHSPTGSDYFIFPRELFVEMPPFAIGRAGWDNWMIYHARKEGWKVVDATHDLMVVHQNHDYSHLPGAKPHYDLKETEINTALGGGMDNMYITLDANRLLKDGKLTTTMTSPLHLLRAIELGMRNSRFLPSSWRYSLSRQVKKMRRNLMR